MKHRIYNKRKINNIYELPPEIREEIEELGVDLDFDNVYVVDMDYVVEDGDPPLPDDVIQYSYIKSIEVEDFDEAEILRKELIERGFEITIDDNNEIIINKKSDS